mmetsp:Transcript_22155/g.22869  ORF Transcript_22155/g.22869 Transcript_22155/m.22869 type:complete len:98 (+) Transcript_22155:19-312(+)
MESQPAIDICDNMLLEYKESLNLQRIEIDQEIKELQNEKTLVERDIIYLTDKLLRINERIHRQNRHMLEYDRSLQELLAVQAVEITIPQNQQKIVRY